MTITHRHMLTALTGFFLFAACRGEEQPGAAASLQRSDSAGVAIVSNPGPDRPLTWQAEEVLRLGPADEGPEAFWLIGSDGAGLGADDRGNLYILDSRAREVRLFDEEGNHLRTMGGEGEGPGELMLPTRLLVSGDGASAVADSRKSGLVRFAPDGTTTAQVTLRNRSFGRSDFLGGGPGGLVFAPMAPYATAEEARERRPRDRRLIQLPLALWDSSPSAPEDEEELAHWTHTPTQRARIDACAMDVTLPLPLTPSRTVRATRAGTAWAVDPEYVIWLVGPDGTRSSIRRPLPPVEATSEHAARDTPTRSLELPDHDVCEVTGQRAVEAMGFEPVVPWITDLRLAPDGHLFVERRDPTDLPTRRIDVFDPEGSYLGTLPEGFPWPAGFSGPDRILRVEHDSLGVPSVVVYAIARH